MGYFNNVVSAIKGEKNILNQFKGEFFSGYLSNGGWGRTYHTNFYELSLNVAPIDEAIDILANAFSSGILYKENDKGELTQDDELIQFLLNPNNNQNFKEFAKQFIRSLYSSGYAYLLPFSENEANLRRLDKLNFIDRPQIKVLNPDCIDYTNKSWFGLVDKNNTFKYTENNYLQSYDFNNVIPFWDKTQDPDNYRIGVSRLVAIVDEIENVIIAKRAKTNKLKQSGKFIATPSSKSLANGFGNQLDLPVDHMKPDYKQKHLIEDKLSNTGFAKEKSITVTNIEMDVKNVMESIQNYSYDDEVREDHRTIKNIFRIPKELQNIGDDSPKYENRKEAFSELFDLVIMPLGVNFTESIQQYYEPNKKGKLVLDYSHHPAFEMAKNKKELRIKSEVETLINLYDKQIISLEVLTKKLQNEGII